MPTRWRTAEDFIARHGTTYPLKDKDGQFRCFMQFPQVSIASRLCEQLTRLEAEFGMTPSARSRIVVSAQLVTSDPHLALFFNNPQAWVKASESSINDLREEE